MRTKNKNLITNKIKSLSQSLYKISKGTLERCDRHSPSMQCNDVTGAKSRNIQQEARTKSGTHISFTSVPGLVEASCYMFLGPTEANNKD